MNREQFSQGLLMLLVSMGVWAAHGSDARNGATPVNSGAYAVTFHVLAPSTVPDGASIACSAKVTPKLSFLDRFNPGPAPVESGKGITKVVNSAADCTVKLPFAFSVSDPPKGAALSYRIDAFTSAGPAFLRTQQGIDIHVPKAGETANLNLNVSL
ncbi:MAG: hypothetical protein ACLPY1_14640 [Terracidiphilus sp.]